LSIPIGTFGSVASLLAATLYQGNHDIIYPIELERRIPQIELGLPHTLTYIWKLTVRTDENFTTKEMISIFPL
jgi:hypothetical protein